MESRLDTFLGFWVCLYRNFESELIVSPCNIIVILKQQYWVAFTLVDFKYTNRKVKSHSSAL